MSHSRIPLQPGAQNLRDPFDILDDDIVRIIVNNLAAVDTENLRRVSKSWKAVSEALCGWEFFKRHFPEEAARIDEDDHGSAAEENLRFRRYCKFCPSHYLVLRISSGADSSTFSEQIRSSSGRNVANLICSLKVDEFAPHEGINAVLSRNIDLLKLISSS